MQKIIIADTSCLIVLNKIDEFDILQKLFGEILITSEIKNEFGSPLPDWVVVKDPLNQLSQNVISASLDKGEASAIALALEEKDPLLILDDLKARRMASGLGLNYTGTLGVLGDAQQSGFLKSIKPIIDKIKKTNFHLSDELVKQILMRLANFRLASALVNH
jgi:predicted nucleic acid-binding protein